MISKISNGVPSLNLLSAAPPAELKDKKVLVRVDFNVPIKEGRVVNDFRIRQTLPTLQLLTNAGATVTAISHLNDRGGSLAPVAEHLKTLAPEVRLLENLRQNLGEEANDLEFARALAAGQDLFVNDAFAVCHRRHASVVGVPVFLPGYAGLLVEKEVRELSRAFAPEHPFIFILGGAKLSTKLPLLQKFLNLADRIFLGGDLLNHPEGLSAFVDQAKVIIPGKVIREGDPIKDVAPEAVAEWGAELAAAKMILWNGPLGNFEKGWNAGTKALAAALAAAPGYTIVGGGDTVAAIEELGLGAKFGFISTGGGAMLDFLANGTLPGLEVLKVGA